MDIKDLKEGQLVMVDHPSVTPDQLTLIKDIQYELA